MKHEKGKQNLPNHSTLSLPLCTFKNSFIHDLPIKVSPSENREGFEKKNKSSILYFDFNVKCK